MADEETTLAGVLRNALSGPEKPFWGDTQWRGPSGYDYIPFPSKNSQMADFLLKAMTLGPMGLRPGGMTPPRAIPRGSADPGITGGSPGYAFHDQWSPHGVPANRQSSTGLSHYDWYGMRNASTGERLANPYPNASRGIDMRNPVEAMSRDMAARLERGEIGAAEALTAYEQAVAQQRTRQDLLNALDGGRRIPSRPANDIE